MDIKEALEELDSLLVPRDGEQDKLADALEMAVGALKAEMGFNMEWISVKDALPEPGEQVLLWYQPSQAVDGKGRIGIAHLWIDSGVAGGNWATDREAMYEWSLDICSSVPAYEARYWARFMNPPELKPLPLWGSHERTLKLKGSPRLTWQEWLRKRQQPETCDYYWGAGKAVCCYPIEDCKTCPNHPLNIIAKAEAEGWHFMADRPKETGGRYLVEDYEGHQKECTLSPRWLWTDDEGNIVAAALWREL